MIDTTLWRACLLGATLTTALLQAANADSIGFVAASEGDASLLRGDQSSWSLALVDQDVEIGDTARTGPESALKLVLVDDTTLTLGEDTELVIDELLVGPAALRELSILRQLRGKLRVRVGEAFGGTTRLQVHTPTAVMGVKGSQFSSWVKREQGSVHTLVCNTGGEVWVAAAGGGAAQSEPIAFGKCRRVSEAGMVGPEIPITNDVFPREPPSSGLENVLALAGGDAVSEMIDPAVARGRLPAVGALGGAAPFSNDSLVEPLFNDSFDALAARIAVAPSRPGFNTATTGAAGGQGFNTAATGTAGGAGLWHRGGGRRAGPTLNVVSRSRPDRPRTS